MKIVCFIGSGFNYTLADIAKSQGIYTKDDTPLHEEIIRLNNLWYQFQPLLSPFNNFIPTKHGEELIEAVAGFQKAYNKFIGKVDDNQIDTAAMFTARIKDEMQKIGEQFTRFEINRGYSLINTTLPNLGKAIQGSLSRKGVESFYLCTTNYDGIIDSLLTYYCENESKRRFLLKDGFIHGYFNSQLFRSFEYKIAHLHGSYKYCRGINGTKKLERCAINSNPVMIYDDPNCKEAAIMKDTVLSANFLELERQLKICDRVITIGNSFKTEPHLKRLISTHFNRPNTRITVCSDKPNEVASILESCYDFNIDKYSTEHIKSEKDLIRWFDQLLGTVSTSMLATA